MHMTAARNGPGGARGVTLLEVVVVIAIIGILVGLLIPAVQRARDASYRTECANNLKQIGLALHGYHNSARSFPAGIRWQGGNDPQRLSSWLVQVLPWVEQQGVWANAQQAYLQCPDPLSNPPHTGLATVIPTFVCPADGR